VGKLVGVPAASHQIEMSIWSAPMIKVLSYYHRSGITLHQPYELPRRFRLLETKTPF
jgi:hypothetical protein